MKQIFTKIIFSSLIASLIAISFPVKQAEAQFVVELGPAATALITGILTATTSTALVSGVTGIGATTVAGAKSSVGATCQSIITALDSSNAVESFLDSTSSNTLGVIGGSPFEFSKINAKLARATAAKTCVDTYVEALSAIPRINFDIGQAVDPEQDRYTKVSSALRTQIESLGAQQNASAKDIMKAFMVKLVLNLNKNLTTKVVNNLIQEYKIDDYLAYGDALATQVYAMKYINQNFEGDARTQMMMRSLIQSEKVPQKARVAAAFANQQAREYVAAQCGSTGQLDAADGNSLACLASYGNEQSSPMFKYLNALDTSEKIKTEAKKTAQAEISQSNGYAPPRDCSGSYSEQKRIDTASEAAATEVAVAANILANLEKALAAGQTTQAEVDKAQAAFEAADKKMSELVNNSVDSPVVDICKAIDSPASYVSNSIQKFLDQHIDQGSKLESDNLPFYATFLSDLTSNFLTNLLTGGKSNSKIFKEAGLNALGAVSASIPSGSGGIGSGTGSGPVGNVGITARSADGQLVSSLTPGQTYTLTVNFSSIKNQNPTEVEIAGTSSEPIRRVVFAEEFNSGLLTINYTASSTPLNLSVSFYKRYDQASTLLIDVYQKNFPVAGTVSGVVTTNFSPRGEMRAPIQIR